MRVELGARSYPVHLGHLGELGRRLHEVATPGPCAVVTNEVVAPLYLEAALASLGEAGFRASTVVLPDGESRKDLDTWRIAVEGLLEARVDRRTPVIALGGGVTGDIAGFAAASLLRGLPLVQVPTTLLAMVDSSVGGKTGVNTRHGKNLVGAFHQPVLVLAALDTLATLPAEELRCGLGEVVKHALLADPQLFSWLEHEGKRLLALEEEALRHAVGRCVEIKAGIVALDEREEGPRALLNLGHTVGHALELVLGYGRLRHGEAVGVGMVAEAWIAVHRGLAPPELPERIRALLELLGLPTMVVGVDPKAVVAAAAMDKKRVRGTLPVAFPTSVGKARIEAVEVAELEAAVAKVSGP